MSGFNVDLKNLFKIAQKANSKTNISDAEKKILNENKNILDIDGNGKFDQDDVVLFVEGDIDGDGKVSEDELNFVSKYKDYFAKAMTEKTGKTHKITIDEKTKAITDEVYDANNEVAIKTSFNHTSQKASNVTYKNGVKSKTVTISKDGTKNTYMFDNNGKKTSSVSIKTDGTKVTYTYKDGVKASAIKTDKNGNKIADYIYFTSGENAGKIKTIQDKNNTRTYTYNKDGDVKNVAIKDEKSGKTVNKKYTYETAKDEKTGKTTKIQYKDGVKTKETVTSKDGKTVKEYTYNSKGQKTSATKNVKGGALTKYEYKDGKVSKKEVYENGNKVNESNVKSKVSTKKAIANKTNETKAATKTKKSTTNATKSKKTTKAEKNSNNTKVTAKNENGKPKNAVETDKNGKVIYNINYTYDKDRETVFYSDASGNPVKKIVKYDNNTTSEVQYDKWGVRTKLIKTSADGKQKVYIPGDNTKWKRIS